MKKICKVRVLITAGLLIGLLASLFIYGGFLGRHPFGPSQMYMVNGANTKILYVGGTGPDNYTKIQDALDDASTGDTVFVYNGTYRGNLFIDTSLTLRGEDKNTTIIEGMGTGDAIGVKNVKVDIQGFTIKNGFAIINSTVYGGEGIVLWSSRNSRIEDNIIINTHSAIELYYSNYNTIIGNKITDNYEGVIINFTSSDNTIADNIITSNIDEGIFLWNTCTYNIISNNTLTKNGNYGIYLDRSSYNTFHHNTISTSQYGLYFYYLTTQNNTVTQNTFQDNNYSLCFYRNSQGNEIYLNNFISNNHSYLIDSEEELSNLWYSPQPIFYYYSDQNGGTHRDYMGNYWDDYMGNDNDGNGLGDTPYTVIGDSGNDAYPLVMQWEQYFPGGNMPPLCTLDASPLSGPSPLTVTFTLNATDADGTIASWTLDINLDGTPEYSGTGPPPTTQQHTYPIKGTYTASLTVTDDNNSTDNDFLTITVTGPPNNPPICTVTVNVTSGYAPHEATFIITANDTDGIIASWTLDINNDTYVDYSGTGAPPSIISHTYNISGIYTVKLAVTDNQGATASSTIVITVIKKYNQVPYTNFTYFPTHPTDLDNISFTDQSFDTDGIIIAYDWDFGDSYFSTLANPQHTYADDGTYLVHLTVTDNDGSSKNVTKTLIILNVGPQAHATLSTSSPFTPSTLVEFMDNSIDPDGSILNSTWSFGDESIAYGHRVNHTYTEEGIYNVTLNVTDDDGDTGSTTLIITIEKEDANGDIPGFEIVILCGATIILLLVLKKKK